MSDALSNYAEQQGDKVALIDDRDGVRQTCTYAELDARVNQFAHVLVDRGVEPGDHVAWCGRNSMPLVTLLLAANRIGAAAVPISYRLTDLEAGYIVDHCDAKAVVVDAEDAPLFRRMREAIPQVESFLVYDGPAPDRMTNVDELLVGAPTDRTTSPPTGGASIIYTSGTTGKPKGAYRANDDSSPSSDDLLRLMGFRNDDIHLTTGPLYHSGPAAFLWVALGFGQTIVLQRRFDPEDWLRLLDRYRCTMTFSAPTPIRTICNVAHDVRSRFDVSSMRIMVANAAPWPFALKQQYLATFPPASLWEVYGSTELGINTVLRPEDQLRKPGSCGTAAPHVEIRLYDDGGNVITGTGPDAAGELYVRSPSTFSDYYKQHDRFEADHRDGFQTVGDVAYRDTDGYYYICDRKRDMIITGGMNVYPAEIEAALELHPAVYEAAVFGIPSDEWGESVHAVVVALPDSGADEASLIEHLRAHLAGYKVPRSFTWVDELPKTGSGKILKRELRAPYWANRDANV